MDLELHKKASKLAYFTVAYNIIEGAVSIIAGASVGSISLIGFGLDSFVESLSSSILIWRFRKHDDHAPELEEGREKKAIKLIGGTFFILGIYILVESAKKLYLHEGPEKSIAGVAIAAICIVIMTFVFWQKFQLGKLAHSSSLIADSKQTLACIFMSVTLLAGLGLNYLYGIWWTDGAAGIIIAIFLFKEGMESYKGQVHSH